MKLCLRGTVVRGAGLGRELGFPTANLTLVAGAGCAALEAVPCGVFRVEVSGSRVKGPRQGVCNVGVRPTVESAGRKLVEVHLLDFDGDLYGSELVLNFQGRIRDERRFAGLDELKAQIAKDVAEARAPRRPRGGVRAA
ncbi:MAG: riboflavin kinase [Elusimicrobia bacterium]|nr:riboflavin kinase [Elusimicrobiota bacterium]